MITKLSEYKKIKLQEAAVNNIAVASDDIAITTSFDKQKEIDDIINWLIKLELSKAACINLVRTVLVDPSKCPDEISVAFVVDNLGDILNQLYKTDVKLFTEKCNLKNKKKEHSKFECVMFIKDNKVVEKLANVLKTQINKSNFIVEYKKDIFYINNFDLLNENNKSIVTKILQEQKAQDISENLKWYRLIKENYDIEKTEYVKTILSNLSNDWVIDNHEYDEYVHEKTDINLCLKNKLTNEEIVVNYDYLIEFESSANLRPETYDTPADTPDSELNIYFNWINYYDNEYNEYDIELTPEIEKYINKILNK